MEELRWLKPVRPGDTLRVEAQVRETRPSASRPDRGTVRMYYEVINQDGEVAMSYIIIHIMARREQAGQEA
jgi:acyl dehydratase